MDWDSYFYRLCEYVSKESVCLSRKIGAVLVRNNTVVTTGFNGPPNGVPHCSVRHQIDEDLWYRLKLPLIGELGDKEETIYKEDGSGINWKKLREISLSRCPRQVLGFKSGQGLDICVAVHAERSALINAARKGICTNDTKMYMNCPVPCSPCLVEIINSGVKEIIVTDMVFYDFSSEYLLKNSNLKCRVFNFG